MSATQTSFLLPQNRKLRHLRGIYLRNLTFSQPRKYSIDDTSVGAAGLASPVDREKKRASLRKALHHSRSSDDLLAEPNGGATARNRSATLSGANALARQHILEQALDSSTADAFFSLHNDGSNEPIYVSEVEERATVHLPS
jgi:UV radiation resistance-associated gene protein